MEFETRKAVEGSDVFVLEFPPELNSNLDDASVTCTANVNKTFDLL